MHLNWGPRNHCCKTLSQPPSKQIGNNWAGIAGIGEKVKKWAFSAFSLRSQYWFIRFYRFNHGTERDGRHVDRMCPGQRRWRHLGLPGRSLQNYENRIKRRKSSQLKRFWWLFWRFIQGKVTPYRHYIVHIWIMLMIKSFARRLASRHCVRKYSRALA